MITNLQQQSFIESEADNILCLAGAGAGKTFSLLERIDNLVKKKNVDPKSILVLTFTNAAARELRFRYESRHEKDRITPEFCTFHAFCYKVLLSSPEIYRSLGYTSPPKIANDATIRRLTKSAKLMSSCELPEQVLISQDTSTLSASEERELNIYNKCLEKILLHDNYITFNTLAESICNMFEDNDPLIQDYQSKYEYIFIDEFQDTDPKQWVFANTFKNVKLCVVGDTLQNIYSFRGADSSIIKALSIDPEWTKIKFTQNYRSDREVVKYANNASKYGDDSYRIVMEPASEQEGLVKEIHYSRFEEMNSELLRFLHNECTTGTTAILSYTNKEAYFNSQLLQNNHIDIITPSSTDTFDLITLVKSISDTSYFLDLFASALDSEKYSEYLGYRLGGNFESECIQFLDLALKSHVLHDTYQKYKTYFNMYHSNTSESEIVDAIKLEYKLDTNAATLQELISEIELQDTTNDSSEKVYVGTVHSVKGLEFDNVIITGVDSKTFRLGTEDKNNLFYVAVTRAKHKLAVFRYI